MTRLSGFSWHLMQQTHTVLNNTCINVVNTEHHRHYLWFNCTLLHASAEDWTKLTAFSICCYMSLSLIQLNFIDWDRTSDYLVEGLSYFYILAENRVSTQHKNGRHQQVRFLKSCWKVFWLRLKHWLTFFHLKPNKVRRNYVLNQGARPPGPSKEARA